MKSVLMPDEESRRKQLHILPQPQELSLEIILPKWALRLKRENIPTFMSPTWLRWRYELQKSSKCIVGEAYGYSSQYTENCDKCDRIGCEFLYYFTFNWQKRLELNKQEFVKHWNEEHSQSERPFYCYLIQQSHDKTSRTRATNCVRVVVKVIG
jgi:hypothetical protein